MELRRSTKAALGIATLWAFAWGVALLAAPITGDLYGRFTYHPVPLLANAALGSALCIFCIVYVFRSGRVPVRDRAMWVVLLFMFNALVMPVFWWKVIRPEPSSPEPADRSMAGQEPVPARIPRPPRELPRLAKALLCLPACVCYVSIPALCILQPPEPFAFPLFMALLVVPYALALLGCGFVVFWAGRVPPEHRVLWLLLLCLPGGTLGFCAAHVWPALAHAKESCDGPWRPSRRAKVLLGVATFCAIGLVAVFFLAMLAYTSLHHRFIFTVHWVGVMSGAIGILLTFALVGVYAGYADRNDVVPRDKSASWIAALVFGHACVLPFFYYHYVLRQSRPSPSAGKMRQDDTGAD